MHSQDPRISPISAAAVGLRSLCVFCGSSSGVNPAHRFAAARLGQAMAKAGIRLVFGGGNLGMMGSLADAVLAHGGQVVGIIPEHLTGLEPPSTTPTELVVVDNMHTRKRIMFERSDAFCVLPGGPGTMDETFEILTWKQLGLHHKPIIIANLEGYWSPWLTLIDGMIAEGFAAATIKQQFTLVDQVDLVIPAAERDLQLLP
ncbi:MAG TPA: TIGR00730 family Rossman fold protein [Rhodospirillaceae bacterium]|nr:TIGR00730 family Rossman fold protein [Rhodospirillaceae bacterium]